MSAVLMGAVARLESRSFTSDNTAGGAPQIIAAVAAAASGQAPPDGNGSAAGALSLAALTPPFGSVVCHRDSHINNDESGVPECATGVAKLIALGAQNAKMERSASGRRSKVACIGHVR